VRRRAGDPSRRIGLSEQSGRVRGICGSRHLNARRAQRALDCRPRPELEMHPLCGALVDRITDHTHSIGINHGDILKIETQQNARPGQRGRHRAAQPTTRSRVQDASAEDAGDPAVVVCRHAQAAHRLRLKPRSCGTLGPCTYGVHIDHAWHGLATQPLRFGASISPAASARDGAHMPNAWVPAPTSRHPVGANDGCGAGRPRSRRPGGTWEPACLRNAHIGNARIARARRARDAAAVADPGTQAERFVHTDRGCRHPRDWHAHTLTNRTRAQHNPPRIRQKRER